MAINKSALITFIKCDIIKWDYIIKKKKKIRSHFIIPYKINFVKHDFSVEILKFSFHFSDDPFGSDRVSDRIVTHPQFKKKKKNSPP